MDAVGEQRVLPFYAVDRSFERNVEAVEALPDAERRADVRVDRQFGEIGADVRTAGIVSREYVTSLDIDAGIFAHIDAAVGAGVEIGTIGEPNIGIVVVGPAHRDIELMALPIRLPQQFRRDRDL